MSRIGATISGIELKLLRRIDSASAAITLANWRLATGHQITTPGDDPSGFMALSGLESQLDDVTTAMANVTAASAIVGQAQLAVGKIRDQLEIIREKAFADADQGLTADQRSANQAAIDAAIEEINRLSQSEISGRRLLDGSATFQLSGINNAQVVAVDVIRLANSAGQSIAGSVTSAGQQAQLQYTGTVGETIASDATIVLTGKRGSAEIEFAEDEPLSDARDRVNNLSYLTGVTASLTGNVLTLKSVEYGSEAEVAVEVNSGAFAVAGGDGAGTDYGADVTATINGQSYTGTGNTVSVNDNGFQYSVEFKGGFSGAFQTITVAGGGVRFTLTPDVSRRSTLALPGLQPSRLGGLSGRLTDLATGGSLAGLENNAAVAIRVADEALGQLTRVEGSLDGFADATLTSSSALLSGAEMKLQTALDSIDKINETEQLLIVARNQNLISNAVAGLAILDDQRASVVRLVSRAAGLV